MAKQHQYEETHILEGPRARGWRRWRRRCGWDEADDHPFLIPAGYVKGFE